MKGTEKMARILEQYRGRALAKTERESDAYMAASNVFAAARYHVEDGNAYAAIYTLKGAADVMAFLDNQVAIEVACAWDVLQQAVEDEFEMA